MAYVDDTDHEVSMQVNASDSPGAEDNRWLPATFVYAGIEVEAQGLFAGVRGRQIAGRFTLIGSSSFAYGTGEQRVAWQSLVATLESTLRLHRHQPGTLVGLADYLYERTDGMIGSLSQLIRGAAILAVGDDEQVTRTLLDLVPVDFAATRATPRRRKHATIETTNPTRASVSG